MLLPDEKLTVAIHEAGHALVAALSPHADPVAKVTILPAGNALGAIHQLPEAERHLYGAAYLRTSLAVRLAGPRARLRAQPACRVACSARSSPVSWKRISLARWGRSPHR